MSVDRGQSESPSALRPTGPPIALQAGIGFRLGRVARVLRADWAGRVAGLSLTPPEVAVLRGVAERPGGSLRSLARTLGTEPMKAKRCVDDLEARGLLESAHRGNDRRSRALTLTSEGRRLAEHLDGLVRHQEEQLAGVLGPALRARLEEALAALERELGLGAPDNPSEAAEPVPRAQTARAQTARAQPARAQPAWTGTQATTTEEQR